jgi:hypothetical protein
VAGADVGDAGLVVDDGCGKGACVPGFPVEAKTCVVWLHRAGTAPHKTLLEAVAQYYDHQSLTYIVKCGRVIEGLLFARSSTLDLGSRKKTND